MNADQVPIPQLALRRRVLRALGIFAIVQTIVALLVSARSKAAARRREALRPETYPHERLPPLAAEGDVRHLQVYMHGEQFLDDVVAAIDAAREFVYVETYIWIDDGGGGRVIEALRRAVARGVRCCAIFDWLLSSRSMQQRLELAGVETFAFRPVSGWDALRPGNLLRDHRKLVVVDGQVGFIGGYNFGDEYLGWRDTHLRLTGDAVHELENVFIDFWNQHRPVTMEPLPGAERRSWDPGVFVQRNDPSLGIFPIRGMYLEAIDRASDRIWITNAYFVPDRAFRGALEDAARRGVDVRILLPLRSNHPLTDALAHGMFEQLLAAGVRIFLYRDFMIHAKTMTVDGVWTTIGTANLDRWSMVGNFEVNAEVRDEQLAAQMEHLFELDCTNAREVHLDSWRRRPARMAIAERTLRTLAPLM